MSSIPARFIQYFIGSKFGIIPRVVTEEEVPRALLYDLKVRLLIRKKFVSIAWEERCKRIKTVARNMLAARKSNRVDAMYYWNMKYCLEYSVIYQLRKFLALIEIELEYLNMRLRGHKTLYDATLYPLATYLKFCLKGHPNYSYQLTRVLLMDEVNYHQIKKEVEVTRLLEELRFPEELSPEGEGGKPHIPASSTGGKTVTNHGQASENEDGNLEVQVKSTYRFPWERKRDNVQTMVWFRHQ